MKVSRWLRLSTLGVIALLGTVAACEGGIESGQLLEPKPESEQVLLSWETGTGFIVVRETEERVGSVEALIGPAGGTLSLGEHILFVPPNAVDAEATFRMEKQAGTHVRLHLTASRHADNDVGRRGFNRPLTLMLSYRDATNLTANDVPALQVMYIRNDQRVEPLPSSVNYFDRWVGTELRHFSEYGIGWPNFHSVGEEAGNGNARRSH